MAQGAYEAALNYSKERKQFGQGDQRVSGDPVQAGRYGDGDRRRPAADDARGADERPGHEDDAGVVDGEAVCQRGRGANAANEGVQIHGGYGFIKDYPAEKFYRDVKLCTIGEGTSEIQRLVIARQILKD